MARRTADRYWSYTRAWLFDALEDGEPEAELNLFAAGFRRGPCFLWPRTPVMSVNGNAAVIPSENGSVRSQFVPIRGTGL